MVALDYGVMLGGGILAATSDTTVDFHKPDPRFGGTFPLTLSQQAWLRGLGIDAPDKVVFPQQVHSAEVWIADDDSFLQRGVFQADAVVTNRKNLPIAVRTADCLPILLYSLEQKAVAAVHAGWKSTRLQVACKVVEKLRALYGADPGGLRAVFGPCIRRESYQVTEEFRSYFPEDVNELNGQLCFDLPAANFRQLVSAGLLPENIHDCGLDTVTQNQLHSFRRDRERAGRMINVIVMV